jgi:hypothetical protein
MTDYTIISVKKTVDDPGILLELLEQKIVDEIGHSISEYIPAGGPNIYDYVAYQAFYRSIK